MAALRLITPTLLKTQLGCTGLNLRLATATRVVVPRSRLPSLTSARAFSVAPALAHAHSHSNSKSDGSRGPVTAALALFGITLAGGSGLFKKPAEAEPLFSAPSSPSGGNPLDTSTSAAGSGGRPFFNVYDLSFGTIAGVCAGLFLKKGLKLIAFFLGAVFIIMQYLSQQRLINVNWGAITSKYDKGLERAAEGYDAQQKGDANVPTGWKGSRAARIVGRLVRFLTTDIQKRAGFVAGLALGFRYG